MELAKNIFFNTDKLVENTRIKLSYTGKFFEDGSEKVFLHYGFGLLWEDITEIKMEKTELGFQAEIDLTAADSFNFCLKNERDEWDNNDLQNYIFPIERISTDLINVPEVVALNPIRKLRKSYILSKKLKLAIYKIITYVPKLISGNYKKKATN